MENINELELRIYNVLKTMSEFSDCPDEVIFNHNYEQDNILDSTAFITLVVNLEEEFSVSIDDDDLEIANLSTFKSIVVLIDKLYKGDIK